MKAFKMQDKDFFLKREGQYADGTPALLLYTSDPEYGGSNESPVMWGKISVCIPGTKLEKDQVLIKTWSECREAYLELVKQGLLKPTGTVVSSGYVEAMICTVSL